MSRYRYYTLDLMGNHVDEFLSFTDLGFEYGVTKGSIAGKFKRAHDKNLNVIDIDGTKIEQVILPPEPKIKKRHKNVQA